MDGCWVATTTMFSRTAITFNILRVRNDDRRMCDILIVNFRNFYAVFDCIQWFQRSSFDAKKWCVIRNENRFWDALCFKHISILVAIRHKYKENHTLRWFSCSEKYSFLIITLTIHACVMCLCRHLHLTCIMQGMLHVKLACYLIK